MFQKSINHNDVAHTLHQQVRGWCRLAMWIFCFFRYLSYLLNSWTVWVAHTVLCSNIETGIGCIASSIPSIRHFLRHNHEGSSSGHNIKRSGGKNEFFTVGTDPRYKGGREANRNHTDIGISLYTIQGRADDNWQRLQDGDSNHSGGPAAGTKGIYADLAHSADVDLNSQPWILGLNGIKTWIATPFLDITVTYKYNIQSSYIHRLDSLHSQHGTASKIVSYSKVENVLM